MMDGSPSHSLPFPCICDYPRGLKNEKKYILFAPQFAEYCSTDIEPLSSLNLIESLRLPQRGEPSFLNQQFNITRKRAPVSRFFIALSYAGHSLFCIVSLSFSSVNPVGESIIPAVHCVQRAKTNIQSEGLISRWAKVKVL